MSRSRKERMHVRLRRKGKCNLKVAQNLTPVIDGEHQCWVTQMVRLKNRLEPQYLCIVDVPFSIGCCSSCPV